MKKECEYKQPREVPLCHCRNSTKMRFSWSTDNPGIRLFGCEGYGYRGGCHFFQWADRPMTPQGRVVILGLLKKVRKMEGERKKERVFWICFFIVVVIVMGIFK